ncbi:MAG: ATP-binding cassette domain-containing protein [Nannocystaceae bacterium]|nr:ATP-binding cassette domain-containing protein [Nannocystaceae bacterium]
MSGTVIANHGESGRSGHHRAVIGTEPVIEVRGLCKAFGNRVLLDHAQLQVFPGETVAIIGASGSGKSVFLKLLVGLLEPDEGEVLYKGKRVADLDRAGLDKLHREVGYVFQADAMFDSMTVLDNVGYALREHTKMSDEEIRERAAECIVRVGLKLEDLDKFPASLSGGMRKRAALARAIAIKPEIILYDEPTQGLDPQNITRIAEMIEELQTELPCTSVVVTHDMRTAFGVSNRIAMLHEARFAYIGTPEALMFSEDRPVREFIDEAMEEIRELFDAGTLGGANPIDTT